ncbi:MAG: phosphoglucosamine mutase [Bacillota bacterium]|nr:phosphoglucosamine mutase [Bacillota bacterium]
MGRLFGTDGARGVANSELTSELAMNIGRAAAMVLTSETKRPKILIGKDTRLSSDMLEGALCAGLCSVGADAVLLGVVPTPAVAILVKKYGADAGIMISASHNPFEYNGIKIFSKEGFKLPDALEAEIEAIILDNAKPYAQAANDKLGRVLREENAAQDYIDHVVSAIETRLDGMKVALDCSNGSSSRTAEKLFTALGAECHMLFDKPDGININADCGSTHTANLQKYVKENKLDAGLAFDGDADRCLAVAENGELIDGDFLIAICAADYKERGRLKKDSVVGTVMTNLGFNRFCEKNDISFVATKVGDRYVLEEMVKEGYNIGGEQSGHIIFLDHCTTGDGEMTGAQLLSIMKRKNEKLSALSTLMERYPQVMVNVKLTNEGKSKFSSDDMIQTEIDKVSITLEGRGRILVRPSGTEPMVRVMLEGEDIDEITGLCHEISELIAKRLG